MQVSNLFQIAILAGLILTLNYYYKAIDNNLSQIGRHWLRSSIIFNYIFFIGTMIHELSHAVTAILLGVRVYKISLFWPQKDELGNYRLGYVEHKKVDPIRTTLIGSAPIFGCALVTFLAFLWAVPVLNLDSSINLANILNGIQYLFTNPSRWQNYLFLYIAIACSLAGDPSDADKKSLPWIIAIFITIAGIFYLTQNLNIWGYVGKVSEYVLNNIQPLIFGVNFVLVFELVILTVIFAATKLMKPRA